MHRITRRALFFGAAGLLIAGASQFRRSIPAETVAIIGFDVSESNRDRLPDQVRLAMALIRQRGAARVILYRVGWDTEEFHRGEPPSRRDALQHLLVGHLAPAAARRGTRPARFWDLAARDALNRGRYTVVLLSDGQNDDQSAAGLVSLRSSIHRLAQNPRVRKVCVWGAEDRTRVELRRQLAPIGEERLEVSGFTDAGIEKAAAP